MGKTLDLTGQVFNKLTAIKRTRDKNGKVVWECQCECGNTTYVSTNKLRSGHTKSCGCLGKNDITGKIFGKLMVIRRVEDAISPSGRKSQKWECKCECGNIIEVYRDALVSGRTKSCGCLRPYIDLVG